MKIIKIVSEYTEKHVEEELNFEKLFEEYVKADVMESMDFDYILENPEDYLEEFIEDNRYFKQIDITKEEEEEFIEYAVPLLKNYIEHYYDDEKEEELEELKDREGILKWIQFTTTFSDEGEVGYRLTPEEILHAIIENANK